MMIRYALGLALLVAPAATAQPDLTIFATAEDASGDAGGRVTLDYTATLTGAEAIEDVPVGFYFSTDQTLSADDVFSEREEVDLESGDPESDSEQIDIPASLADGDYFILVVIDDLDFVAESDETNNTDAIPFTVGEGGTGGAADLRLESLTPQRVAGVSGETLSAQYTLANAGSEPAGASTVALYFSADAALSAGDRLVSSADVGALGGGEQTSGSFSFVVPRAMAGDYFLIAVADDGDAVSESDEQNNATALSFRVVERGRPQAGSDAAASQAKASGRVEGVTPNPVAHRATVRFELAEAGPARLAVVDALGREVAVLAEGSHAAGVHDAAWDAARLAPGLYVLRLDTAGETVVWTATVAR